MSRDQLRRRPGRRRARHWHRWLGVAFGIPLLWLTVSGLVLRHADRLGLHEAQVKSGWLLRRYGMIPEGKARGCAADGREVNEWGENLFFKGSILDESGVLVGAVAKGRDTVVATREFLLVYDEAGGLADQLGEESLPAVPLEAIGVDGNGAVMVRGGGKAWRIADDFLSSEEAGPGEVRWCGVKELPDKQRVVLEAALADQAGISAHRVWLDLHSGNLFGWAGKLTVDLSGIAIVILSGLGFGLVMRKPRDAA